MAAAHGNGVQGFFKRDIWLLEESEEREEEEEEGEGGRGRGRKEGQMLKGPKENTLKVDQRVQHIRR